MCLGVLWERFGMVWDVFSGKILLNFGGDSEGVEKCVFQKCLGVFSLYRAASNNHFGSIPEGKYTKNKHMFFAIFYIGIP